MVQGVGGTGSPNTNSLQNCKEYSYYYDMYKKYKATNKTEVTFEGWLVMKGYSKNFRDKVENYIETGSSNAGDGTHGNKISDQRYVTNGNSAIYQSQDEDCYYEFDYEEGTYTKIESADEIAKKMGLPEDANVDTIKFGYQSAQIIDYTFGNLDDGQDKKDFALVDNKYYGITFTQQEFDIHYIVNALLMDETDPQYQIALACFQDLCANINQWLPASEQAELDEVAAQYTVNSAEYKAKLQELILKNLDQANEWIEEHTHVANTNASGTLEEIMGPNGTDNENGVNGDNESNEVSVNYEIENVLTNAGLLTQYSRSEKRKVESTDNSESNRRKELQALMDQDLSAISNALLTTLGDQATDEIKTYINKAISTVVADESLIDTWSKSHGFLGAHKKTLGEYDIKVVADRFFEEFDTICKNKGKTTEEVAAAEKVAAEKKENDKTSYQTLYNLNISSLASEIGVNKDVQVVNVNNAAEIQAKANADILAPIKAEIKSKMSGQSISDSELDNLLEMAGTAALSNCTQWSSTTNNYVYTINSNELIRQFESNVKTIIKQKGYEF